MYIKLLFKRISAVETTENKPTKALKDEWSWNKKKYNINKIKTPGYWILEITQKIEECI